MNSKKDEHKNIIDEMLKSEYKRILDLGSGKTSMTLLLNKFQNSNITGICYPGDNRKLDKIRKECIGKYLLLEKDICNDQINQSYDLVLCHLLLGEALKFGNTVDKMSKQIFKIDTKNILIIDYLEDVDIDFDKLIDIANKNNFVVEDKKIFAKKEKEQYTNFIGENYIAILFKKEEWKN